MLSSAAVVTALIAGLLQQKFVADRYSIVSFLTWFLTSLVSQVPFLLLYKIFLYPHYLSLYRKLPQAQQSQSWRRMFYEPTGDDCLRWMQAVENDGLIRYLGLLNSERILVTSTQGLAELFQTRPYDFVKSPGIRKLLVVLLGDGLVVAEGNRHKFQRKNLTPAFSFRRVKDLHSTFWDKACEYCSALDAHVRQVSPDGDAPSAVVSIVEWNSRVTLDIICVTGFGDDPRVIENPDADWYQKYRLGFVPSKDAQRVRLLALLLPGRLVDWLPLKRVKEVQKAQVAVKEHLKRLLAAKREDYENNKNERSDMISHALRSGAFSDADLLDQSMTLLAAGHETTAGSLSFAAYVLSQDRRVQARLREEIREMLPSPHKTRTLSSEELYDLPYMSAVCSEILRLYTPIPMLHRSAAVETTILGIPIARGTNLRASPWAISRTEQHWGPTASDFVPERWLEGPNASKGGANSHYSFMAFSQGVRNCIGASFARAEFAACLACLVGRFDIELESVSLGEKLKVEHGVTARIDGGLLVRLTPVDGW